MAELGADLRIDLEAPTLEKIDTCLLTTNLQAV
jgi:hypothetical protein